MKKIKDRFSIRGGVVISDPFSSDNGNMLEVLGVKSGKYLGSYSVKGDKVSEVAVSHSDYELVDSGECIGSVTSSSGVLGLFDLEYFEEMGVTSGDKRLWKESLKVPTRVEIENEEYIPFEKSEFWKEDFRGDMKKNVVSDMLLAESEYYMMPYSFKFISVGSAGVVDGKVVMSSAGNVGKPNKILVGRDMDGEIVSIKIIFPV